MRAKYIIGNWKMNGQLNDWLDLAENLSHMQFESPAEVVVCPPHVALSAVKIIFTETDSLIGLGAQDVSVHEQGAHTGETSAQMLTSVGCEYVIVGHSERRIAQKESSELVSQKADRAYKTGIMPIICIGEEDASQAKEVLPKQLAESLSIFKPREGTDFILAYEPVWAIGSGKTPAPDEVESIHQLLRAELVKKYGEIMGNEVAIIYGGSVKPENAASFLEKNNIDGVLVGGASLHPEKFGAIVSAAQKMTR